MPRQDSGGQREATEQDERQKDNSVPRRMPNSNGKSVKGVSSPCRKPLAGWPVLAP